MLSKEKALTTMFLTGNVADALITWVALGSDKGFIEVGAVGSKWAENELTTVVIVKLGLTALLIGGYALAKSNKNGRLNQESSVDFEYVFDKSLQLGTVIVFMFVVFNTLQYATA